MNNAVKNLLIYILGFVSGVLASALFLGIVAFTMSMTGGMSR